MQIRGSGSAFFGLSYSWGYSRKPVVPYRRGTTWRASKKNPLWASSNELGTVPPGSSRGVRARPMNTLLAQRRSYAGGPGHGGAAKRACGTRTAPVAVGWHNGDGGVGSGDGDGGDSGGGDVRARRHVQWTHAVHGRRLHGVAARQLRPRHRWQHHCGPRHRWQHHGGHGRGVRRLLRRVNVNLTGPAPRAPAERRVPLKRHHDHYSLD